MKSFKYIKIRILIISTLIAILTIFCAFMFSCSGENSQSASLEISGTSKQEDSTSQEISATQTSLAKNEIQNVSVDDVSAMLKDKNKYFLLDVRTQEEYKGGFIENSILIPVAELKSRLSEIPSNKPIIVYCASGNRSKQAAQILVKNNFNPVYNMLGGITEWGKRGYPVVK
ncbi:MAG: rhodanese-like domain-containing protein [Candidatus Humimicrobiaceae bacterium]